MTIVAGPNDATARRPAAMYHRLVTTNSAAEAATTVTAAACHHLRCRLRQRSGSLSRWSGVDGPAESSTVRGGVAVAATVGEAVSGSVCSGLRGGGSTV